MTQDRIVGPLTEEQAEAPGWVLTVDGKQVPYREGALQHPNFGSVRFGQRPEGYPGWVFEENSGGGSVIVPYLIVNGETYIGMVQQARPLQSENPIWNVPRGFIDPGESPLEAAIREQEEEFGFQDAALRIRRIPGMGTNPNSTFFVTTGQEGVTFTAFRVFPNEVEEVAEESLGSIRVFRIREDLANATDRNGEAILAARFMPWTLAAQVGDMFSVAGVGRLAAAIEMDEVGFALERTFIFRNRELLLKAAAASPRLRHMQMLHGNGDRVLYFFNALMPGTYVQPHRHGETAGGTPGDHEYFTIIEGEADVLFFNDAGEITHTVKLRPGKQDTNAVRIPSGTWHSVVAHAPTVLNEAKPGPYVHETAKEFATWAPSGDASQEEREIGISFLNDRTAAQSAQ